MNNKNLIKKAFIADLIQHPSSSLLRKKAEHLNPSADMDAAFQDIRGEITKADVLTADHEGLSLMDHENSWKNFPRLANLVAQNDSPFNADDFAVKISARFEKTLLESAVEKGGVKSIFTPEIWKGRFSQAESLFYAVPIRLRQDGGDGLSLLTIKRNIFALEGKTPREDVLAGLNIEWRDFPEMFKHGGIVRLRSIAEKLERHGLNLTKEDLFFADKHGDNMFFYPDAWANFEEIVGLVSKGGEKFEVEDFFRSNGVRPPIVKRAQEKGAMKKLFSPVIWEGRLDEMLDFWSRLQPLEKQELGLNEFADLVAKAEDKMYQGLIMPNGDLTLNDLRQPIAIEGKARIYPLGLASTWQDWDKIQAALTKQGEHVKMSMLRRKSGHLERTILEMAVKNGHLAEIVGMMGKTNQSFQVEDLMQRDLNGSNLLTVMARRKELGVLFTPDIWVGHVNDMKTLWAQVPIEFKSQVNWSSVLDRVNVQTLNSTNKPRPPLKRKR